VIERGTSIVAHDVSLPSITASTSEAVTDKVRPDLTTRPRATSFSPAAGATRTSYKKSAYNRFGSIKLPSLSFGARRAMVRRVQRDGPGIRVSNEATIALWCGGGTIDRNTCMKFLGFAYRFVSNFIFLALVYYSLNFMERYQQRAILAILVLVYATMRAATAFRSFYFFQRIECLELDARRLAGVAGDGPAASASRRQIVNDVASLRRDGEMKSYIDLLFLALVILLCISKLVTE
jgi:hypothetical protein